MRKFLLIAMVMFTLPMFAQNYTMRLAHLYVEDGYELWDYIYSDTEGTNLVCINETELMTPMECIDSLFYDERGNIVKLATHQKVDNEWIYACYVEYTYDENNLKTSRKNYNSWDHGATFELGGIYRYYYDEEGKMTNWALEFFGMEEWQTCVIDYNEKGLKIAETMQQYSYDTYYMENQFLTEYEYDDNGNVVRENEFYWDLASTTWQAQVIRTYEYDEFDNCIKQEQQTVAGTVQERKVYSYDTNVSAENVYYYPNPEQDFPALPPFKSLLKSFEYWAQNDENVITYVTDYLFDYEVIADAVAEIEFESSVYPNPAQDFVMVESSEADYVEVVDVYGRVMFSSEMSESVKVDMSEFASGIYFVKLQADGATSVQKIMKK